MTVGEVFDVAVDIRRNSPFFGQWTGQYLSAGNKRMIWIPPGFAHGFCVTSEVAEFEYKCTDYYAPEHERCIRWDDPFLDICWPVESGERLLISEKDMQGRYIKEAELF